MPYSYANQIKQALAKNLRALRLEHSLTQRQVADVLDVSFQQVQKYENGKNRLPAESLYILRMLYRVPYGHFFRGLPLHEYGDS